jgi:hypothetical protein
MPEAEPSLRKLQNIAGTLSFSPFRDLHENDLWFARNPVEKRRKSAAKIA